jgi:hypothetical protein
MIPPLKLVDENNAEYEASSKGWAVKESIGIITTLNPGVQKKGTAVFDVPKGHVYKLKISGGYFSAEDTLINLSPK